MELCVSKPGTDSLIPKSVEAEFRHRTIRRSLAPPYHEEQLLTADFVVAWTSGGRVVKSFRPDDRVRQAVWCSFADFTFPAEQAAARNWICLLHDESLTVFRATDGDVYHVALPFRARRIFPLLEGLLIERATPPSETLADPDAPTLFSLLHPLEVIKPFSLYIPESMRPHTRRNDEGDKLAIRSMPGLTPQKPDEAQGDYLCDPSERVVYACPSRPLLLTYNIQDKSHTLWVLHQSLAEITKRLRADRLQASTAAAAPIPPASISEDDRKSRRRSLQRLDSFDAGTSRGRRRSSLRGSAAGMAIISGSGHAETASQVDNEGEESTDGPEQHRIESEVLVERVWTQKGQFKRASSVFLAADEKARPLLCLVFAEEAGLTAYRLSFSTVSSRVSMELAFSIPCISAVSIASARNLYRDKTPFVEPPLQGTDRNDSGFDERNSFIHTGDPFNRDILTINKKGLLRLYTGETPVGEVQITGQGMARTTQDDGKTVTVTGLSDAVDDCVTLHLGDGKMVRARLKSAAAAPAVAASLSAIDLFLPPPTFHAFRADFFAQCTENGAGTQNGARGTNARSWTVFSELINNLSNGSSHAPPLPPPPRRTSASGGTLRPRPSSLSALTPRSNRTEPETPTIHPRSSPPKRKTDRKRRSTRAAPATPSSLSRLSLVRGSPEAAPGSAGVTTAPIDENVPPGEDGNQAWEKLLSSGYHKRFERRYNVRLLGAGKAVGKKLQKSLVKKSGISQKKSSKPVQKAATGREYLSARANFQDHAGTVLLALHLLYEDTKLDTLGSRLRLRLLPLLRSLAKILRAEEYLDRYNRDYGQLDAPPKLTKKASQPKKKTATKTLLPSSPPSIFRYLQYRLVSSGIPHPSPLSLLPQSYRKKLPGYPCGFPFHRLRRIIRFYDLLFPLPAAPSHTSAGLSTMDLTTPTSVASGYYEGRERKKSKRRERGRSNVAPTPRSPLGPPIVLRLEGEIKGVAYQLFSPSAIRRVTPEWTARSPIEQTVLAMAGEGMDLRALDAVPFGVAAPLRQALNDCREDPPSHWPAAAYRLIGREDLAALFSSTRTIGSKAGGDKSGRDALAALRLGAVAAAGGGTRGARGGVGVRGSAAAGDYGDETDGTALVLTQSALRFGRDKRVKEVCRMLRSNRLIRLRVPPAHALGGGGEGGDGAVQTWKQVNLFWRALRVLALPIGRGMLTLGSLTPDLTEALPVPQLELRGVLPPKDLQVSLDPDHPEVAQRLNVLGGFQALCAWSEFHNGVAIGLRVSMPPAAGGGAAAASSRDDILRTWVAYNRPRRLNNTHAGFLMALGLRGHLAALSPSDMYWYLSKDYDSVILAILLGTAAGKAGSLDVRVSKMLCLRIPALLPPAFADLNFSAVTQTAALVGIGLLYRGSKHRLMTELLLNEIGNRPVDDRWADQGPEAYSLAAGMGLGLVCLGQGANHSSKKTGSSHIGLLELQIQDRLRQFMNGGPSNLQGSVRGTGGATGVGRSGPAGEGDGGSRVKEGKMVNVDVTAPGATVALGLMYLKSDNEVIAGYLSVPDTHFSLDFIRPDFIMLRVFCRGLVLWSKVQASQTWVESQIPSIISSAIEAGGSPADAKLAAVAAAMAAAMRAAQGGGDDGDEKMDVEDANEDKEKKEEKEKKRRERPEDIDYEAIRHSYCYIIAGACLAIGFRFAGTADAAAQKTVAHYLRQLLELRRAKAAAAEAASRPTSPSRSRRKKEGLERLRVGGRVLAARGVVEACVAAAATALGLVMAGTGQLETLKLLRAARTAVDANASFGTHQVVHMSIGMLFLGGGRLTLASTPEAIAALVCAFFPRFATHPNDNRYYLQALRHLYVLAIEPRCIQCIDVVSGAPCYVPLQVETTQMKPNSHPPLHPLKNPKNPHPGTPQTTGSVPSPTGFTRKARALDVKEGIVGSGELSVVAPCLIPPLDSIRTLRVASPRFWPISLPLRKQPALRVALQSSGLILYVKRKAAHLPYRADPRGVRSLGGSSHTELAVNNSSARAFVERFGVGGNIGAFCVEAARECVAGEKMEVLPALLEIRALSESINKQRDGLGIWNLRLALDYSRHGRSGSQSASTKTDSRHHLLGLDFLNAAEAKVDAVFSSEAFSQALAQYILALETNGGRRGSSALFPSSEEKKSILQDGGETIHPALFGCYLEFYDFPTAPKLRVGMKVFRQMVPTFVRGFRAGSRKARIMALVSMVWSDAPIKSKVRLAGCLTDHFID